MSNEETIDSGETPGVVPEPEVPAVSDASECDDDDVDCVDEQEARETEQIKADHKERERLSDSE